MWKYILFLIAIHTLGRLPLGAGYAVAQLVGRLVYWLSPGRRRDVDGGNGRLGGIRWQLEGRRPRASLVVVT